MKGDQSFCFNDVNYTNNKRIGHSLLNRTMSNNQSTISPRSTLVVRSFLAFTFRHFSVLITNEGRVESILYVRKKSNASVNNSGLKRSLLQMFFVNLFIRMLIVIMTNNQILRYCNLAWLEI